MATIITNKTWDYTTGSGSFNNQKPTRLYMGTSNNYQSRITLENNLPSATEKKAIVIQSMTFHYSRVNPASGTDSTFYIGETRGAKTITVKHTEKNEQWATPVDISSLSNIKAALESGTSSINIYFCGKTNDSNSTRIDMATRKAYISVSYVYGESTGSLKTEILNLDETQQLTINPVDTSYSHGVTWYLNGKKIAEETKISAGTVQTTFSYPSNTYFKSEYFSTTSATTTGKVVLKTYDGDASLGNGKEYSFTVQIPESIGRPTISLVTFTPSHEGFLSDFNPSVFVANYSYINWKVSASGGADASISKIEITFSGGLTETITKTIIEPKNTIETTGQSSKKILRSSSITATTIVTDSRGFSTPDTQILSVYSYSTPKLILESIKRTNSTGKEDFVNGEYATFIVKSSYSSLGGANSVTATVSYLNTSNKDLTLGTAMTVQVSTTNEVQFTATITDKATEAKNNLVFSLPASSYLLYFLKGGKAIGIGTKVTSGEFESTGLIKMGWPVKLTGGLSSALPLTSGGTESNSRDGAFNKIVAPGGTITGSLNTQGTLNVQGTLDMQGTFSIKNSNIFPQISFIPKITTTPLGKIYVYGGAASADTVLNSSRFAFRQYSYTSNSTTVDSETYDTFLLPKTEANIASGTKKDYEILTTKNYPYSSFFEGFSESEAKKSTIVLGNIRIEMGTVYDLGTVPANGASTKTVNFAKKFSNIPTVVACFHATSTNGGHGSLAISVCRESEEKFDVIATNGDTAGRLPNFNWIAIGLN